MSYTYTRLKVVLSLSSETLLSCVRSPIVSHSFSRSQLGHRYFVVSHTHPYTGSPYRVPQTAGLSRLPCHIHESGSLDRVLTDLPPKQGSLHHTIRLGRYSSPLLKTRRQVCPRKRKKRKSREKEEKRKSKLEIEQIRSKQYKI